MNRLATATSPYLLQHAHNPVDWYPWGAEALDRARAEDRPILLSVGYAACHWCHVMERESFEDAETAAAMNAAFVCVKVDREERPDLDSVYMRAVQAFTRGHGGWPMTVFLTPDGRPFFAGTYFPPRRTGGLPSFGQVMAHVVAMWRDRRADAEDLANDVAGDLQSLARVPAALGEADVDALAEVARAVAPDVDEAHGGFGGSPKFPPHGVLAALLARAGNDAVARRMALDTLHAMARGGMYDLLGGGFARYSVDAAWRVPHFEKMLYDNAQLLGVYTDAWRLTRAPRFARVVRETAGFLLRALRDPTGAFWSALDADTDGVEGATYAWTPAQLRGVLGEHDGARAAGLLEVTEAGTFEHGASVLRLEPDLDAHPEREWLEDVLARLHHARQARPQPAVDDKAVTAWNGLAIDALARAGATFGEPAWVDAAARAADAVLTTARTPGGGLARSVRAGVAAGPAFADDHAALCDGLLSLYEASFDPRWLREAETLADALVARFWDAVTGTLWFTPDDGETLVARPRNLFGGAEPGANAVAARAFARLDLLLGRADLGAKADAILRVYAPLFPRAGHALGWEAVASGWRGPDTWQLGIVGAADDPATVAMLGVARRAALPFVSVARVADGAEAARVGLGWLADKGAPVEGAIAYLCARGACRLPVTTPEALEDLLVRAATATAAG